MEQIFVKAITILQPNGRIVIPAPIRQRLNLGSGQRLEVTIEKGRIVLTPPVDRLRQAQALLSQHVADDKDCWSQELIAERRAEAEGE